MSSISSHHLRIVLDLRRDELKKAEKKAVEHRSGKWHQIYVERAERTRERIARLEAQLRELEGAA